MATAAETETRYCPNCAGAIRRKDVDRGHCAHCNKPLPAMMISLPSIQPDLPPTSAWSKTSSATRDDEHLVSDVTGAPADVKLPKLEMLGWGTVRTALLLIFAGGIALLLTHVVLVVLQAANANLGTNGQAIVDFTIAGTLQFGFFVTVMGIMLTLASPNGGARAWAITASIALWFIVVSLLLGRLADTGTAGEFLPIPDPSTTSMAVDDAWILRYVMMGLGLLLVLCLTTFGLSLARFFYLRPVSKGFVALLLVSFFLTAGYFVLDDLIVRDVVDLRKSVLQWMGFGVFSLLYGWFVVMALLLRNGISTAMRR